MVPLACSYFREYQLINDLTLRRSYDVQTLFKEDSWCDHILKGVKFREIKKKIVSTNLLFVSTNKLVASNNDWFFSTNRLFASTNTFFDWIT